MEVPPFDSVLVILSSHTLCSVFLFLSVGTDMILKEQSPSKRVQSFSLLLYFEITAPRFVEVERDAKIIPFY